MYNIRKNEDIPLLLANNEGYFVASTIEEVNAWILTHQGKIEAMKSTLVHIQEQYEQRKHKLKQGEDCGLTGQISIFDLL